ncbi:hypothetical protein K1719_005415 [Acacia pycnantha]|nr:hypothetical protein K1719_005415 [Acacia pycnantha]
MKCHRSLDKRKEDFQKEPVANIDETSLRLVQERGRNRMSNKKEKRKATWELRNPVGLSYLKRIVSLANFGLFLLFYSFRYVTLAVDGFWRKIVKACREDSDDVSGTWMLSDSRL